MLKIKVSTYLVVHKVTYAHTASQGMSEAKVEKIKVRTLWPICVYCSFWSFVGSGTQDNR